MKLSHSVIPNENLNNLKNYMNLILVNCCWCANENDFTSRTNNAA